MLLAQAARARGKAFSVARQIKFSSDKYRNGLTPASSWIVSSLFAHFAPTWQSLMTSENWSKCCARFMRGGFDAEFMEKYVLQPDDVDAKEFRFIASYGIDDAPDAIQSEEALDAAQAQAQTNLEEAMIQEVGVQLSRERARFHVFQEASRKFQCETAAARMAFKASEAEANMKLVETECATRFPVALLEGPSGLLKFHRNSVKDWIKDTCDPLDVHTVWYANLLVSGAKFQGSAGTVISRACDMITLNPLRTCLILIMPNTGKHGDVFQEEAVGDSEGEIWNLLNDDSLGIRKKRIILMFDESTIPEQSKRAATHMAVMCVSNTLMGDGKRLASNFAKSKLWIRGVAAGLPMLPNKDMVHPTQKMMRAEFSTASDLTDSVRAKQHFGGWRLVKEISDRLWTGMGLTSADKACWFETHPFDGSSIEMNMRQAHLNGPKYPQIMCLSALWAPTDLHGGDKNNALITGFLEKLSRNVLTELAASKQYPLSGFSQESWAATETAPVLKPSEYKCSFPSKTGSLALRGEWVKAQESKFKLRSSLDKLSELFKQHNDQVNPSGVCYEGEEPRKRKHDEAAQREAADEIPEDPEQPTREALLSKHPDAAVIVSMGQELIFTRSGEVWCHGLTDDVVVTTEPLARVFGKFHVGKDADKFSETSGKAWNVAFNGPEDLGFFTEDKPGGAGPFPAELRPVSEFAMHLQNSGRGGDVFECHRTVIDFTKNELGDIISAEVRIVRTTQVLFEPQEPAQKIDFNNAGSLLTAAEAGKSWGPGFDSHTLGRVKMMPHWRHISKRGFVGVAPAKPGLYLTKPIRVVQGSLRRWA